MSTQFLRLKKVVEKTGLSSTTIYRKMDEKDKAYDPKFPKSISLGGKSKAWIASEIEEWQKYIIEQSRQPA